MLGRSIRISADSSRSFIPVPSVAVAPRATLRVRSSIRAEHCEYPSFLVVNQFEPIQLKLCCASLTSLQGDQHDDCRIFITSDAPSALRDYSTHRWALLGATSVGQV